MLAGVVTEFILTFMFVIIILGTTHQRAPVGFAGVAIGLALTLIHLISIPVTNTSVRSGGGVRALRSLSADGRFSSYGSLG